MTPKEHLLESIKTLARDKVITKKEIIDAFDASTNTKSNAAFTKKLGVAEVLLFIGGAVVFLGIIVLLWQNWTYLGFFTKIVATLGSGAAAYFLGFVFSKDDHTESVGSAFYLIYALVTPIGLWVLLDNAGIDASSYGSQVVISAVMLASFLASQLVFKKHIFILFSVLYATWVFFSVTSWMVTYDIYDDWEYYMYRIIVAGLSYILLGYSFSKTENAPLSGFLYGFGIFGVLGAALALGNWDPNQNIFWELIYPGLVFGALFASVHIKSQAFLTWGTFFLMAYILKITGEYFTNGLGWPLALVVAGLSLIGVGYMALSIKKKYLVNN